jgi:general stress protein YciG
MAKDQAAVSLGRKGGKARLKTMTPEERSEIARRAGKASALKRWGKKPSK